MVCRFVAPPALLVCNSASSDGRTPSAGGLQPGQLASDQAGPTRFSSSWTRQASRVQEVRLTMRCNCEPIVVGSMASPSTNRPLAARTIAILKEQSSSRPAFGPPAGNPTQLTLSRKSRPARIRATLRTPVRVSDVAGSSFHGQTSFS